MAKDNLDLIAKMLRKAEGTNNEHERAAFMDRAQTLASRYSIDLAVARAHTAKAEQREQPEEITVELGPRGKQGLALYVNLFTQIAGVQGVKCLISSDSTTVYALGMPSDIEVAKALYASLVMQMVEAGDAYIKSGEYKEEQVWVNGRWAKRGPRDDWGYQREEWVDGHYKPVDGRVARRSFYTGFTSRVVARLSAAKQEVVEAAVAEAPLTDVVDESTGQALSSTALVLREKSKEVEAFVETVYKKYGLGGKRSRSWKGNTSSGGAHGAASAGRAAGNSASLGGARGRISA